MNKIDLGLIYEQFNKEDENHWLDSKEQAKRCMKEAIHQALVLASENVKIYTETLGSPHSNEWEKRIDKQSIFSIEELIV